MISQIRKSLNTLHKFFISDSKEIDLFLTISIIVCMIPTLFAQILVNISPEIAIDSEFTFFGLLSKWGISNGKICFGESIGCFDFVPEWGLTEWLISYDGGFVRRGLPGEIIKLFSISFEIPPYFIIVFFSLLLLFVVTIWTIRSCGNKYPLYVILSPMLLGAPVFAGYLIRKDLLVAFMFMIALNIIISNRNIILKFILTNIVCVLTILSHEMFLFVGFPLLILVHNLKEYGKKFTFESLIFFSFPIITTIFLVASKGNPETSWAIVNQWNYLHLKIAPTYCCYEHLIANFHFLSADTKGHFELNSQYWTNFIYGIFWTPGIWVLIWLVTGIFLTKLVQHFDRGSENKFQRLYLFQTVFAIPLFIMSIDHGRWIILISFMSFYAVYALNNIVQIPLFEKYINFRKWNNPLVVWQKIAIILFFGFPHLWVNLTLQLHSIPILDLIFYIYFILTGHHILNLI